MWALTVQATLSMEVIYVVDPINDYAVLQLFEVVLGAVERRHTGGRGILGWLCCSRGSPRLKPGAAAQW